MVPWIICSPLSRLDTWMNTKEGEYMLPCLHSIRSLPGPVPQKRQIRELWSCAWGQSYLCRAEATCAWVEAPETCSGRQECAFMAHWLLCLPCVCTVSCGWPSDALSFWADPAVVSTRVIGLAEAVWAFLLSDLCANNLRSFSLSFIS